MTPFAIVTFVLGLVLGEVLRFVRTYMRQRAEDVAHHAAYPARHSEHAHSRLAEYREKHVFDGLARLASVRNRLVEIIAVLERRLPDPQEGEEIESELKSVATEIRAIANTFDCHSGLYDEALRRRFSRVIKRLRNLVVATEDLSGRVTETWDESYEEFLKDSLQTLKKELDTLGVTVSALAKAFRDAATPEAIGGQDIKRLT
jgi:hypothetical protein